MDDRERRDFEAGLAEEVDAWLRGETSRRTHLKRLIKLGALAAMPGPIWAATSGVAQAAAELADPSTPLGKAQALALKASTEGPADGSAYRAVQAA